MHSRASGREISMHYFSFSGGHGMLSIAGTGYTELAFLHLVGVCVSRSAFVHPGCETSTHFFSFSGGPSVVSIKSTAGHVTTNLCYRIQWDLSVT
jgi:hypothetical protein